MKYSFLLFAITVTLFGCEKNAEDIIRSANNQLDLIELFTAETDGTILVINSKNDLTNSPASSSKTYIRTANNANSTLSTHPQISFNQDIDLALRGETGMNAFPPDTNYERLFGRELAAVFSSPDNSREAEVLLQLGYVPSVLNPTLSPTSSTGIPELHEGFNLTWNGDAANASGVYILIDYLPAENPELSSTHQAKLLNYINVPDNGTYVLRKSDFPEIPGGSVVTLQMIRGNGKIHQMENNGGNGDDLAIVVYSKVSGYCTFQ